MANIDQRRVVTTLLDRYGTTYAQEIGIRLQDKPAPLFSTSAALLRSADERANTGGKRCPGC
ncbi:MAG: hypothetical protein WD688_11335 [Candidatus Binatia bacterium]